jgi:hypothetical protein
MDPVMAPVVEKYAEGMHIIHSLEFSMTNQGRIRKKKVPQIGDDCRR